MLVIDGFGWSVIECLYKKKGERGREGGREGEIGYIRKGEMGSISL